MVTVDQVVYVAFVLSEATQNALRDLFKVYSDGKVYCHHVTLAYGDADMISKFLPYLGNSDLLNDFHIDCLLTDGNCLTAVLKSGKTPLTYHVTLWCKDGVKPVYSNELIREYDSHEDGVFAIKIEDIHLEGKVQAFLKSGTWVG